MFLTIFLQAAMGASLAKAGAAFAASLAVFAAAWGIGRIGSGRRKDCGRHCASAGGCR